MALLTPTSPHIHSGASVTQMMVQLIIALVPAIIAYSYFFGWGLIINIIFATACGLTFEIVMLRIRQRPIWPFITDGSVVVTAVLFAFCIPSLAPWWLVVIGLFFAVVVAKHLYGGLGYNPFNPAMVGYVVLLISFPQQMTSWLSPLSVSGIHLGFLDTLLAKLNGQLPHLLTLDTITAATPLDAVKTQLGQSKTVAEIVSGNALLGDFAGVGWEWVANWLFLGGIWLLYKQVISWHIPFYLISSMFVIALFFYLIDPDFYLSPMFHIFSGATIFAAFFIATDPVTASTTPLGKCIYAAGIGLLTYIIRVWGGYPDGIAFAVLLMNMAAPTIDYYTQPRVYGHKT
ncbi:MAG: electron transport complex subunit RsxD [Thiohalomonadales bacterium]